MYTRPGQQGTDEMQRDLAREPHCADPVCRHMIWTHNFMAPPTDKKTCSVTGCKCAGWRKS